MDDKWQKIREIFDKALRHKPEDRRNFVLRACGEDKQMLAEVDSLFSSLESADGFLETPAVGMVADVFESGTGKLEPEKNFGHYEILEKIGAGGMGEVYLAQDKKLDRKVALKILNEKFARDESNLRRFIREARAASALNHPNILVIHEIGAEGEMHFIVSEYVKGKTLREVLKETPLPPAKILDIAVQIANALTAAHEEHLVHRDIKPENVIIRPDGLVKILDFGLAKIVERKNGPLPGLEDRAARQNLTAKGVILGTINYMSPEQVRGLDVDSRTDIWSLGVCLYEMLTGKTPFACETTSDTISAVLNKTPAPLAAYCPDTLKGLERIIDKTLRKDRAERYQHIEDLLIDLKDFRQEFEFGEKGGRSTAASGSSEGAAAQKATGASTAQMTQAASSAEYIFGEIKRRRRASLAVLAFLLVSMIGSGYWFFSNRTASTNINAYISAQKVAQITNWSGLDDFPSLSPDGNTVAYCSDHNGSFEIYVKQLTPGAKEIQLTNDGGQNFQPAFSPDGQHIAYYSKQRGGISIIPASGGEARQITDFGSHPAWSPDGRQIAFQSNPLNDLGAFARNALPPSTLWVAQVLGGALPRQLTQAGALPGGQGSPAWSPDGKRIAFEVDTYNFSYIWTVAADGSDAKAVFPQTEPPSLGYAPIYTPDGKSILYHNQNGTMFQVRINPATDEAVGETTPLTSIAQAPSSVRRVSFSADGKKIAYNVLRRVDSISSVPLQTKTSEAAGTPNVIVSNTTSRNNFPVFSPDGRRLAYSTCSIGGTGCDIWLANADGTKQTQLTTSENNELLPSWFPDGEQIGYLSDRNSNRSFWSINLNTKREQMLFDAKSNLEYARLSPDGKRIIFNDFQEGVTNVWTAALLGDGEPKQLTFDKEMMGFSAWSNDGKLLALQVKRGDDTNIMVMPSDGGTPEQLTFDKGQSWVFGWSPDNDKILFAGLRGGFWNVWWVSRSTKKQQQITDYKKLNSFVRYPSWSPLGNQVVYEYSETTGNIWVADLK
jgi:Tol biopolymer transport system component/tRNA A-37 threonylcarbamoyl transferase component Bud32